MGQPKAAVQDRFDYDRVRGPSCLGWRRQQHFCGAHDDAIAVELSGTLFGQGYRQRCALRVCNVPPGASQCACHHLSG